MMMMARGPRAAGWVVVVVVVVVGLAVAAYGEETAVGSNTGNNGSQDAPNAEAPACSEESKGVLGKGGLHCECPPEHRICVGPRCSVARNATGHVVKQGFHVSCKTCMCIAKLQDGEGKDVDVYESAYRHVDAIHLIMVLADASPSLERKFVKCLHSLVERVSKPVTLHLITDDPPQGNEHLPMSAIAGVDLRVYHGHDLLHKAMEKGGLLVRRLIPGIDKAVRQHLQQQGQGQGQGGGMGGLGSQTGALPDVGDVHVGGMTVTEQYLALLPFYHLLFPDLERALVVDADVVFRTDIALLWQAFYAFRTEEIVAMVHEQQPTFRNVLAKYRAANRHTHVGSPPTEMYGRNKGLPGFNTGVTLLHLGRMRASDLYTEAVYTGMVDQLSRKFMVSGRVTPALLFTMMAAEHPFLFRVLPCKWNRQTCQAMRGTTHGRVFEQYHRCDDPVLVYHESCNTPVTE